MAAGNYHIVAYFRVSPASGSNMTETWWRTSAATRT
jgi:hypothetical protein